MSTLLVRLRASSVPLYEVPVAAQVLNSDFELIGQMTLQGEGSIEVPPGVYHVLAELPSGESVSATTKVGVDAPPEPVTLNQSSSPHEWISWQRFLGEVPEIPWEVAVNGLPPAWVRLWHRTGRDWIVQPSSDLRNDPNQYDETSILYRVDMYGRLPTLWFLQIGGPAVPWRLVSVPYSPSGVEILVRVSRRPTVLNGGLTVKVVTLERHAETLSHYLAGGALGAAQAISHQVLAQVAAEELLRNKLPNPYGAAVGGYYLLRSGDYERLHDWPSNFANWVDWLPDAAVIRAWQLLYEPRDSARWEARRWLLRATERGLPVLTEGLRLLIDGLELFAGVQAKGSQRDEEITRALTSVREYAAATDWNQRLTTFYGVNPSEPSLESQVGVPANTTESLRFLPPSKSPHLGPER